MTPGVCLVAMGLLREALGGAEITSHAFHAVLPMTQEQDLEQLNSIRITEREWAMALPRVAWGFRVGSVLTIL